VPAPEESDDDRTFRAWLPPLRFRVGRRKRAIAVKRTIIRIASTTNISIDI
jgi:hypothetical protein